MGFLLSQTTYLPLISKTASEPTGRLFTSSDTFQNTKTQNYFPDLFQQNWEENQGFSVPHSKISTVTPALLSKQTSAAAAWRGRATWAPRIMCCSCCGQITLVPGRAERDTPRTTPHAPKPYRISYVKPDFQGQLEGCWINTRLVAPISLLQGSVHRPSLALFSRQLLTCICSLLLLLHLYTQILL